MRVLVQWTRRNPRNWEEVDSADWPSLPARPVPAPGQLGATDNAPGWVWALCVQGVELGSADHYAVEPIPGGCRVTLWNDDPDDWPPGTRWADVWEFRDGWADRTLNLPDGSSIRHQGPDQRRTIFREDGAPYGGAVFECGGEIVPIRPWSEFVPPAGARHGISVTDELATRHLAVRSLRGWEEWTARP